MLDPRIEEGHKQCNYNLGQGDEALSPIGVYVYKAGDVVGYTLEVKEEFNMLYYAVVRYKGKVVVGPIEVPSMMVAVGLFWLYDQIYNFNLE